MTTDAPVLRLTTTAELLTAVPYLFGFQPRESLVVLGFRGKRVGFHLRVDLSCDAADAPAYAQLMEPLRRNPVEGAVLVLYHDEDGPPSEADRAVYFEVSAALTAMDVEVRNAIALRGSRWYSLTCTDPRCCPADGTPYDGPDGLVASELVLRGATAAESREELERRLDPLVPGSPESVRMFQALEAADEDWARLPASVFGEGRARLGRAALASYVTMLAEYDASGALPSPDAIAGLLFHLVFRDIRDELVATTLRRRDTAIPVLTAIVRHAVDQFLVPAPATLLGLAHWRAGDGAMASIAFQRALDVDADYRLAQMFMNGLMAGLPPSELDALAKPLRTRRSRGKRLR